MSEKTNTEQDGDSDAPERTCRKCKGAGVLLTTDTCRTDAICCDQCSAGNRIWSRLHELLADLDVPSPISPRSKMTDSIVRNQMPRV
jgi:hypothetical protein